MLQGLVSLFCAASVLIGMGAVGRAFYCLAKRMEWDGGPERRLWTRRYAKAMFTFLIMCIIAMLMLWIRHVSEG